MPDLSIIINTCAGTMEQEVLQRRGTFGHPDAHPYAARAAKLERIVEQYVTLQHELIVVGEWHAGDGYQYVHAPGPTRSPFDALLQRHVATQVASGNQLLYLNDDHYVTPEHMDWFVDMVPHAHATAIGRRCYKEGKVYAMEDGWADGYFAGYIMGHACFMSRHAVNKVPWISLDGSQWDVKHTIALHDAHLAIQYIPHLIAWDVEIGELPT